MDHCKAQTFTGAVASTPTVCQSTVITPVQRNAASANRRTESVLSSARKQAPRNTAEPSMSGTILAVEREGEARVG